MKQRTEIYSASRESKPTYSKKLATSHEFVVCGKFSILPSEVIVLILQHFSLQGLYGSISRVNKALFALARSGDALNFKADLRFLAPGGKKPASVLLNGLSRINGHSELKSIKLGCHSFGPKTTEKLLKLIPAVESINFYQCKNVNLLDLGKIAAAPALKELHWGWALNCSQTAVIKFVIGRGALLEILDIKNMGAFSGTQSFVTDALMTALSNYCPNLAELRLSELRLFGGQTTYITDEGIEMLCNGCKKLRIVEMRKMVSELGKIVLRAKVLTVIV